MEMETLWSSPCALNLLDQPGLEFNHDWRLVYRLILQFVTYGFLELVQEIVPETLNLVCTDLPKLVEREVGVDDLEAFEILVPYLNFDCEVVGNLQLQRNGGVYDVISTSCDNCACAVHSCGVALFDSYS